MIEVLLLLGGWLLIGCAIAWGVGRASDAGRTFDEGNVWQGRINFDDGSASGSGNTLDDRKMSDKMK